MKYTLAHEGSAYLEKDYNIISGKVRNARAVSENKA